MLTTLVLRAHEHRLVTPVFANWSRWLTLTIRRLRLMWLPKGLGGHGAVGHSAEALATTLCHPAPNINEWSPGWVTTVCSSAFLTLIFYHISVTLDKPHFAWSIIIFTFMRFRWVGKKAAAEERGRKLLCKESCITFGLWFLKTQIS